MFLDKLEIPTWLDIVCLILTGIVLGAMFAYGVSTR